MPDQTVQFCNADYRVLHQISWQHAVRLILKGVVYVIDTHQPAVHVRSASLVIELPVSIALREYVYIPYTSRNRVTRVGVLRRDGYTCVYCGAAADTWDHVLPRCRGGVDSWLNTVAACRDCNGFKGDRTPHEAGMTLMREPFEPREPDRFTYADAVHALSPVG
ncbi:restriction endonuclease [Mycobacteroides saopaulense]|uniref:Restriction endonuclease n=2 Tax=Mycobacteroides saopaulense TaxID=1578165 RepID=A0ABX3C6E6_9MYCO|nr:restriction endonuclease [Mycobacteroides saopaulense]OHU14144.1 restriction endonuclease [Mycobacteroides saopaulense]